MILEELIAQHEVCWVGIPSIFQQQPCEVCEAIVVVPKEKEEEY